MFRLVYIILTFSSFHFQNLLLDVLFLFFYFLEVQEDNVLIFNPASREDMNNVVNLTEDKLMLGGLLFEEALLLAKRRKKVKPSSSGWYISFVSYLQYSFLELINSS